jgi:cyclopropane fatty-acyl-phospholipid synthase-like methyltransferase
MATSADPNFDIQQITKDYYDSEDAFNFYEEIWGGENIHIGLYDEIKLAKEGDADAMLTWTRDSAWLSTAKLFTATGAKFDANSKMADFGSGYGGTCRYGAKTYGMKGVCVDISEKENAICRKRNKEEGLEHLVSCPGELSCFDTGLEANSYDLVTSQDCLMHCGNERYRAIKEAARILKPGGFMSFTDPMQSDTADPQVLRDTGVLQRIHLDTMGSVESYTKFAKENGMKLHSWEDRTWCLMNHYGTVRDVLKAKHSTMKKNISQGFVDGMCKGLDAWVDAANKELLCWGFLVFQKE